MNSPFLETLESKLLSAYDASYLASIMTIVWGGFLVFGVAYLIFTGRKIAAPLK